MTATLMPWPVTRIWNAAGTAPLAGGKVWTYEVGTTTPKTSYTDSTATIANTNPVILDATGSASIWISGQYKINVLDANDVQQPNYPVDNVADFHTIDNITATSTTSLSISTTTATKVFTTQTDKFFSIGLPVFIVANGHITNNMYGQVTGYSGTQLTVGVTSGSGSGTYADWTISLSGPPGPTGNTGGSGAGSGDMLGSANLAVGAGGVADAAAARSNLALGTAATHDTGTSATNIPVLDGSAKMPAVDASAMTNLNASALASGTVPTARLGSGTASSTTILYGDSTFKTPSIPAVTSSASGKIVMGAVTIQWGTGSSGSVSFGTPFSAPAYSVSIFPITSGPGSGAITLQGSPSSSGAAYWTSGTASTVYFIAIGPT